MSFRKQYIYRKLKYRCGAYRTKKFIRGKPVRQGLFPTLWTAAAVLVIFFLLCRFEYRLGGLAVLLGSSQLENTVLGKCNEITADILAERQTNYSSVISVQFGENGKINSLSTDFNEINAIKTELSKRISEYLNTDCKIICKVPIGALISDDIMAAWGICIPAQLISSGSAAVEFLDNFDPAGINQTRHRLMLRVTVSASIHTIFNTTDKTVLCDIPIAETVIVGDVPNFMLEKSID